MISFDDPIVSCPFDKSHLIKEPRLIWHLLKCKVRAEYIASGKPVFNCRFFHQHILFNQLDLISHERTCDKRDGD